MIAILGIADLVPDPDLNDGSLSPDVFHLAGRKGWNVTEDDGAECTVAVFVEG